MKISILGTRGIPANYGGFETFASEISARLVEKGFEVMVQCDSNETPIKNLSGVKLYYSPYLKSENPLKYYYYGIKWGLQNSDILLVTGTGGSIFYFLNLFKRKILITNPDGLDHKRSKWPLPVRLYLKLSEILAFWLSDFIIADSLQIKKTLIANYKKGKGKIRTIEYGADMNNTYSPDVLDRYSLYHCNYYLTVCRLEPENNLHMILEAFSISNAECPIVVVGNLLENSYVKMLTKSYNSEKVRFLGGIYEKEELKALRFSCKAYLHGHSVGGTNPSLIEAMGSRNLVLCHDNVYNREVTDNKQLYFKNSEECKNRINWIETLNEKERSRFGLIASDRIFKYYKWERILSDYISLFDESIASRDGK